MTLRTHPTPRRWPWGLIGMLALVLSAERFVAGHDHDLTNTTPLNWRYAGKAAASEAVGCEVLCLGTSRLKFGIAPRVIEDATGKRTINLAICNGDMPASHLALRRALEAGARPSVVLVDGQDAPVRPEHLRRNLRNWPEFLTPRDALELALAARDPDFLAATSLSRLLPSYKARFEIRGAVTAALAGRSASTSWEFSLVRRNWRSNRGAHVTPRNPAFEASRLGETVETPPAALSHGPRAPGMVPGSYAQKLLDLAAAHGIRVVHLIPPVSPRLQEERNRSGEDFTVLTRFAAEAQAYDPGLIVIDGRRSGYTAAAFWDDNHLNAQGASAFSAEVAAVLTRHLPGPPPDRLWVTLPPYRDPGQDSRLETIAQSGVALKAGAARR